MINISTYIYFSFLIPFIYYSFLSDYFKINTSNSFIYKHFNQDGGNYDVDNDEDDGRDVHSYINDLIADNIPSTSSVPSVNYSNTNYKEFTGETSVLSLKTTDANIIVHHDIGSNQSNYDIDYVNGQKESRSWKIKIQIVTIFLEIR